MVIFEVIQEASAQGKQQQQPKRSSTTCFEGLPAPQHWAFQICNLQKHQLLDI